MLTAIRFPLVSFYPIFFISRNIVRKGKNCRRAGSVINNGVEVIKAIIAKLRKPNEYFQPLTVKTRARLSSSLASDSIACFTLAIPSSTVSR